jgi:hypothetical protein
MPLGGLLGGKNTFPELIRFDTKKRLNNVFIKKLLVFPNFETHAFSFGQAFLNFNIWFYLIFNAKTKS